MRRRELIRYHDLAATTKTRGEGIGFAGVGIKLGLLVWREVLTETRRGKTHVATRWHLASRHRVGISPQPLLGPPPLASRVDAKVSDSSDGHLLAMINQVFKKGHIPLIGLNNIPPLSFDRKVVF